MSSDSQTAFPAAPVDQPEPDQPSPLKPSVEPPTFGHLHWSSLLFDILAHGRQYLFPIAIGFLGAAGQNWFWGVIAFISLFFSLLSTLFRYFTLQFGILKGELVVKQGLLVKNTRTIPTGKIQNIDLRQNILHRLFGVFEVHVETASGQDAEAVLRVLTQQQIDRLRSEIVASQNSSGVLPGKSLSWPAPPSSAQVDAVANSSDDAAPPVEPAIGASSPITPPLSANAARSHSEQTLLEIPITRLLLAGMTSNRGWVVLGVLIGLYYQFASWDSLDEKAIGKWIRQMLPLVPHDQFGWLGIAGVMLLFWLGLKLFGMGWYVVRFYGYRLASSGDDLRVTCGLFTSYSVTVPRERIQFISLQQPWLFRSTGHVRISIETAGGASQADGQDQIQIMRSAFVPIVSETEVVRLLGEIRPGLVWDDTQWHWQGPAQGTRSRLLRFDVLVGVIISGLLGWFVWPWGLAAAAIILPLVVWHAIKTARSLRYARAPFGPVYRSGLMTRKTSMTFFEKLQTVQLVQSPFDRRWSMAELHFDTAGAGPADHQLHVRYLDQNWALTELAELRRLASDHQPRRAVCIGESSV